MSEKRDNGENIYTNAPKIVKMTNKEGLYSSLPIQRIICQKVARLFVTLLVMVCLRPSFDMSISFAILINSDCKDEINIVSILLR